MATTLVLEREDTKIIMEGNYQRASVNTIEYGEVIREKNEALTRIHRIRDSDDKIYANISNLRPSRNPFNLTCSFSDIALKVRPTQRRITQLRPKEVQRQNRAIIFGRD